MEETPLQQLQAQVSALMGEGDMMRNQIEQIKQLFFRLEMDSVAQNRSFEESVNQRIQRVVQDNKVNIECIR